MPKQVDYDQRRRQISRAAAHIAATRGLRAISFREVAAAAGVSVSLVQHYFGSKDQLLVDTLALQSGMLGTRILERLQDLGPDGTPAARLRVILGSFIPDDDDSREAMLLYLGYAGAALTDPTLRRADAFRNAEVLRQAIAEELRLAEESGPAAIDPGEQALGLLSMVLGLALAVLLDHSTPDQAIAVVDGFLERLPG